MIGRATLPVPAPLRLVDGDRAWRGVDQRTDPGHVEPGYVSNAVNTRFTHGKPEPRLGNPIRPIGPGENGLLPFDRPQGATVFKDPNGSQWFIVAAGGRVYRAGTHHTAEEIPLPAGVTLEGEVNFTQAFSKLILWRGESLAPLALTTFALGFETVTQATSDSGNGTGTLTIPNAKRATFLQNRVFALNGDNLYASDARNYTRYTLLNQFRINEGSDDTLLAARPFGTESIVAFKSKSIHVLTNLVPDSSGNLSFAVRETLTTQHGLVAPEAIAQAGRDLFYFSTDGLTSIRLTEENRLKATEVPLSWPMSALWDRINWSAAHLSQLAYWDSKLYWAIPVDGSPVPNCIAVYDFRLGAWAGTDEGDSLIFGVLRFLPAFYLGQLRLFLLDWQGLVRLYEEGYTDERQGEFLLYEDGSRQLWESGLPKLTEDLTRLPQAIRTEVLTRGYGGGNNARQRFYSIRPELETYNPAFTVTAEVEGVAETETLVSGRTRSRTAYTTFNTAAWDPADGATHGAAHREDYSVVLPAGGMTLPAAGVTLGRHQSWEQPLTVRSRGRWCQLRFTNTTGRAVVRTVAVESAVTDQNHLALT